MRISPIFCQIFFSHQTHNGSFSGCVALICDCWVLHNSYHFPVSHWDGSMTYREISVSHWLVWITYRARPQSDTVNVYNNIYIYILLYVFIALPILLFSFFSRMRIKQETRVHPSHLRGKPDKQRGIQGVNPPFTGIHENVTNGVKRWTLCDRKAQNVNAFFLCKRRKQRAPEGAEAHSPGQHPGYKAISRTKDASSTPWRGRSSQPRATPWV